MSKLLITGASPRPPPETSSPQRLEISDFVRDIKQFSLYIQALRIVYNKPTTVSASFFQIAGIHGMPYVDWEGSPSGGRGYCVHGTELFLTWHRPYVVLFEQEVQRAAREIAATYTTADRLEWGRVAGDLRQPYWGWDNSATYIPPLEVTTLKHVEIIVPNGSRVSVSNPFYDYAFPPETLGGFPAPYNTWPTTLRHPSNGESRPEALIRDLKAVENQTIDNTARLYSLTNWNDFTSGGSSTSGLEAVHNTLHNRTGGGGHMQDPRVAAFDPIFWLHHAQVDRVIGLWQDIHKGQWTTSTRDLTPFWNTQATYWKSPEISDTEMALNYSYAGPISTRSEAIDVQATVSHNRGVVPTQESDVPEWSVRVRCKQFEVGGSFTVFIFLGNIPADPTQWLTDPAFAGTFDVFANGDPDECANCNEQRDLIVYGYVHLNRSILAHSPQTTLGKDVVVPYLRQKLNWGVEKADGTVVNVAKIASLEVTVECTKLSLPVGAEFPTEGEPEYYHDITLGRVGGHRAI